jgi:hypothetical protein
MQTASPSNPLKVGDVVVLRATDVIVSYNMRQMGLREGDTGIVTALLRGTDGARIEWFVPVRCKGPAAWSRSWKWQFIRKTPSRSESKKHV